MKKYCLELCDLMSFMIDNLIKVDEISTFVSSLMFNNETLDDHDNFEDLSESD
jgi:hypothetical protein